MKKFTNGIPTKNVSFVELAEVIEYEKWIEPPEDEEFNREWENYELSSNSEDEEWEVSRKRQKRNKWCQYLT